MPQKCDRIVTIANGCVYYRWVGLWAMQYCAVPVAMPDVQVRMEELCARGNGQAIPLARLLHGRMCGTPSSGS